MAYGFGTVPPEGFSSLGTQMVTGAWGAVALPHKKASPLELTVTQGWKQRLTIAIDAVGTAGEGDPAAPFDAAWDRVQRRFDARVVEAENSDDEPTRAAAARVRASMLRGDGTGQTQLEFSKEVDWGRHQLREARRPSLAKDLKHLGLTALLADIETTTNDLDRALKHSGGGASPSVRIRRALSRCVAACNAVTEAIDELLARGDLVEAERTQLEALRAPLTDLADRYTPSAPSGGEGAQQGSGAQPATGTGTNTTR